MRFSTGTIVATPAALKLLTSLRVSALDLLKRHLKCDWSEMSHEDQLLNEASVRTGLSRIFSAYTYDGHRIWIITEWNQRLTTIALPSDY